MEMTYAKRRRHSIQLLQSISVRSLGLMSKERDSGENRNYSRKGKCLGRLGIQIITKTQAAGDYILTQCIAM
jgi:hypothetical protein